MAQPQTFTPGNVAYNLQRFPDDRNRLLRVGNGNWSGKLTWGVTGAKKPVLGGNPPEPMLAGTTNWAALRNRLLRVKQLKAKTRPGAYQTSRWREPWQPPSADRKPQGRSRVLGGGTRPENWS